MNPNDTLFSKYLLAWHLKKDGEPIKTNSSYLLPVIYQGLTAMLKIALSAEECLGAELMVWWDGKGAARVLKQQDNAILLERATSKKSLLLMARNSQDDEASLIACEVISQLHSTNKNTSPTAVVPLKQWFQSLIGNPQNGVLTYAAHIAAELLEHQHEIVILHGDIHHQNILDFGEQGWLAIDPKGLIGDRAYDYANLFCNPDWEVATKEGRLQRQATIVAAASGIPRTRLLKWICAYAGLSATWFLEEGHSAKLALAIADIARAELEKS